MSGQVTAVSGVIALRGLDLGILKEHVAAATGTLHVAVDDGVKVKTGEGTWTLPLGQPEPTAARPGPLTSGMTWDDVETALSTLADVWQVVDDDDIDQHLSARQVEVMRRVVANKRTLDET